MQWMDGDGNVFEITAILPYVKRTGKNPISGLKMTSKDLIQLHFAKDAAGKYA